MSEFRHRPISAEGPRVVAVLSALLWGVTGLACADDAAGTGDDPLPSSSDLEEATMTLQAAIDAGYQTNWSRAPGWETPKLESLKKVHGDRVDIFINPIMAAEYADESRLTLDPATRRWPEESVAILDAYTEQGTLVRRALMKRAVGGSWFYSEYIPASDTATTVDDPLIYGYREASCTNCHNQGADQIISFRFPPGLDMGTEGSGTTGGGETGVTESGEMATEAGTTTGTSGDMSGTGTGSESAGTGR